MSADVDSSHGIFIDLFFQGIEAVQCIWLCFTLLLISDRQWTVKARNSSKKNWLVCRRPSFCLFVFLNHPPSDVKLEVL